MGNYLVKIFYEGKHVDSRIVKAADEWKARGRAMMGTPFKANGCRVDFKVSKDPKVKCTTTWNYSTGRAVEGTEYKVLRWYIYNGEGHYRLEDEDGRMFDQPDIFFTEPY